MRELGGHFDKWPVYGAVTQWMSIGKSFPTSISVCFSVLVYVSVYVCGEGCDALVI